MKLSWIRNELLPPDCPNLSNALGACVAQEARNLVPSGKYSKSGFTDFSIRITILIINKGALMVNVLYTAHGSATGGRDGHGATDDKKIDVKLSVPREMGGDGGAGTNPEQLFATGYSACYLGAIRYVAGQEKVKIADNEIGRAHV